MVVVPAVRVLESTVEVVERLRGQNIDSSGDVGGADEASREPKDDSGHERTILHRADGSPPAAGSRGYHPSGMPTQAEIEFFARWNAAARRGDQRDDDAMTMAERLEAVARLSATVDDLLDGVDDTLGGIRRA